MYSYRNGTYISHKIYNNQQLYKRMVIRVICVLTMRVAVEFSVFDLPLFHSALYIYP